MNGYLCPFNGFTPCRDDCQLRLKLTRMTDEGFEVNAYCSINVATAKLMEMCGEEIWGDGE